MNKEEEQGEKGTGVEGVGVGGGGKRRRLTRFS